ncbi:head GIN domain-containing protein [Allosphingosinicella sp.]|uniref:head GIN domain-containing protein n=1 Tax=Allosphingosinicella sp. TaxID=2823234 RepID=UPI002ED77ECB
MKRTMLALLAIALAAPAQAADRRVTITDFDRVQVDGPFEVVLATGKPPSATISGSTEATDRVSVEVQGRMLRVRPNRSAWSGYPGATTAPAKITLSTHDLRSATVVGSGSLSIDKVKTMRFDASLSGSGRLSMPKVEADTLIVGLVGSGAIEVGGKAKTVRAGVQGTGDLNAQALTAEDAEINADTAGTINMAVRRAATVNGTGSGDTVIAGSAACTVKLLGSGQILCSKYSDQRQR